LGASIKIRGFSQCDLVHNLRAFGSACPEDVTRSDDQVFDL